MTYPKLLILKEKHGNWNYLIESEGELHEIALKHVKERMGEGYYFKPSLPEPESAEQLFEIKHGITLEKAKELLEINSDLIGPSRTIAEAIDGAQRDYICAKAEHCDYQNIHNAIDNNDGSIAWYVLSNRSMEGYEYEDVELESFDNR